MDGRDRLHEKRREVVARHAGAVPARRTRAPGGPGGGPARAKGELNPWVAALCVLCLAALLVACHPRQRHLTTVHTTKAENVCIELHTGAIGLGTAFNNLRDVLENDALGWETRATINFAVIGGQECEDLSNRDDYQIEVHIWDSLSGRCSAGYIACLKWITRDGDPHEGKTGEWRDYKKVYIYFHVNDVLDNDDQWTHLVNHEHGPAVGLADPTVEPEPPVNKQATGCSVLINQRLSLPGDAPIYHQKEAPIISIMHDSRCSNVPFQAWPTIFDFASFDLNSAAFE